MQRISDALLYQCPRGGKHYFIHIAGTATGFCSKESGKNITSKAVKLKLLKGEHKREIDEHIDYLDLPQKEKNRKRNRECCVVKNKK